MFGACRSYFGMWGRSQNGVQWRGVPCGIRTRTLRRYLLHIMGKLNGDGDCGTGCDGEGHPFSKSFCFCVTVHSCYNDIEHPNRSKEISN